MQEVNKCPAFICIDKLRITFRPDCFVYAMIPPGGFEVRLGLKGGTLIVQHFDGRDQAVDAFAELNDALQRLPEEETDECTTDSE